MATGFGENRGYRDWREIPAPAIPELEDYEGRGVYYWASPIEAGCAGQEEVVLVGGGNSAGQAMVFLASHATHVHHLIRGPTLQKACRNI